MHAYPGLDVYRGWPTRDGFMPHGLFWVMHGQIPKAYALDRLYLGQAVATGIGIAMGDKKQVREIVRHAVKEMFEQDNA
jgi:hypothetical protein